MRISFSGNKLKREIVRHVDVFGIAGERDPAEGAGAGAEERTNVLGDEAGDEKGVGASGVEGEAADVVAVVEGDGAGALQGEHGIDVDNHGCGGAANVFFGIAVAEFRCFSRARDPAGRSR